MVDISQLNTIPTRVIMKIRSVSFHLHTFINDVFVPFFSFSSFKVLYTICESLDF